MVLGTKPLGQNTAEDFIQGSFEPIEADPRIAQCEARGGTWNAETQTCDLPIKKQIEENIAAKEAEAIKQEEAKATVTDPLVPETFSSAEGRASGITLPDGRTFLGLSPEDVQTIATGEQEKQARPEGTAEVGTSAEFIRQQQIGQQQAGQVGQFGTPSVTGATGFDFQEATVAGLRTAIPSAIGGAATAFGAGLIGAKVGGVAGTAVGPVGTAIGAALGFAGGITAGILRNMESQRRDTTTAQQRVLDEGKQNLADWRTLAESNPSRRQEAIAGFNKQLYLIDQAYQQMKIDTQSDVLKFETALPNLAEFETFYSTAGERDFLVQEMRLAMSQPVDPQQAMMELAYRRTKK